MLARRFRPEVVLVEQKSASCIIKNPGARQNKLELAQSNLAAIFRYIPIAAKSAASIAGILKLGIASKQSSHVFWLP